MLALTQPLTYTEVCQRPYYTSFQRMPQDMQLRNNAGQTCLHVALKHGHYAIAEHLLQNCGANVNIKDWTNGDTLLHYAVQNNDISLANFLVCYTNMDINARRYDGATALDIALMMKNRPMTSLLVSHNAVQSDVSTGSSAHDQLDMETDEEYDDIKIAGVLVSPPEPEHGP